MSESIPAEVGSASDDPHRVGWRQRLPERWPVFVALVLLVVATAASTGPRVFTAALWGDELRTWRDGIEKPLTEVLLWRHNPDHAPLGHLLARGGAAIFGVDHPWALRLGSWLCGLACVPALWWMGRTLWDSTVGLAMATIAVVDPNLSSQMTIARMYAPLLLTAIAAITLAGSILVRPDRPWRRAMLLGLAIGVGIWTHAQIYAIVLAILVAAAAMLRRPSTRRTAVALLVAIAIGGAIGAQGIRKIVSRHDAEAITAPDTTDAPGGQLEDAVHELSGKAWITYTILVVVIGSHAIMITTRPTHRWLSLLLAALVAIAILDVLVAARYRPVAHARYLTVIQPALWFSIALVLVDVFRTHRRGVAAARVFAWGTFFAWIGLCVFEATRVRDSLEVHPLARPFADAAREIRRSMAAGDRFVVVPRSPYGMYTRYFGLLPDNAADDALAPSASSRLARGKTDAAHFERGTIWLLCIVPPPNIKYRNPLDDPAKVVRMIADARHAQVGSLEALNRSDRWHTVVVRIDDRRAEIRQTLP